MNDQLTGSDKQYLTREEAANILRVSIQTLDRYAKSGKLKRVKLGRLVRIERGNLFNVTANTPR